MLDSNKTTEYKKNNYEKRIRDFSSTINKMIDQKLLYIWFSYKRAKNKYAKRIITGNQVKRSNWKSVIHWLGARR